jgi:hypothetical protein
MGAIGRFGGRRPRSGTPFPLGVERPESVVRGQLFVALTMSRQKFAPARVMWGRVGRAGRPPEESLPGPLEYAWMKGLVCR